MRFPQNVFCSWGNSSGARFVNLHLVVFQTKRITQRNCNEIAPSCVTKKADCYWTKTANGHNPFAVLPSLVSLSGWLFFKAVISWVFPSQLANSHLTTATKATTAAATTATTATTTTTATIATTSKTATTTPWKQWQITSVRKTHVCHIWWCVDVCWWFLVTEREGKRFVTSQAVERRVRYVPLIWGWGASTGGKKKQNK